MVTTGNQMQGSQDSQNVVQRGIRSGVAKAMESVSATNDAAANVDNAGIFTKFIKKAEDSAQSAL